MKKLPYCANEYYKPHSPEKTVLIDPQEFYERNKDNPAAALVWGIYLAASEEGLSCAPYQLWGKHELDKNPDVCVVIPQ